MHSHTHSHNALSHSYLLSLSLSLFDSVGDPGSVSCPSSIQEAISPSSDLPGDMLTIVHQVDSPELPHAVCLGLGFSEIRQCWFNSVLSTTLAQGGSSNMVPFDVTGAAAMAWHWRVQATLSDDSYSVPGPTTCNSKSREPDAFFWPLWMYTHVYAQTHRHTCKQTHNKKKLFKKMKK
jgi:hypothetical protein